MRGGVRGPGRAERPVRRSSRPAVPVAAGAGRAARRHRRAAGPRPHRRGDPAAVAAAVRAGRGGHRGRQRRPGRRAAAVRPHQPRSGPATGRRPDAGGEHAAAAGPAACRHGAARRGGGPGGRRRPGGGRPGQDPAGRDRPDLRRPGHRGEPTDQLARLRRPGTGLGPRGVDVRARRTERSGDPVPAGPDPGDPVGRPLRAGRHRPDDRAAQGRGGGPGPRHDPGQHPGCPAAGATQPGRADPDT